MLKRVYASVTARAQGYAWRTFEASKPALHRMARHTDNAHLFVFGCQRSGTTHLERLFRADPRSVVFGEFSALSIPPDKTFWRPLPEIASTLSRERGRYTVSRSLLASDFVNEILGNVPQSAAVWMFRDAPSVVRSMVQKWGPDLRTISQRVESDANGKWRLWTLWDEIEREVDAMESPARSREQRTLDLYALYWERRNRLVFDHGLLDHPQMVLMSYDTLTRMPDRAIAHLLAMVGVEPPRLVFPLKTKAPRRASPSSTLFSPEIAQRCDALYSTLADRAWSGA